MFGLGKVDANFWCSYKCQGTPASYRVYYKEVPFILCDTCYIDFKENGPGWQ